MKHASLLAALTLVFGITPYAQEDQKSKTSVLYNPHPADHLAPSFSKKENKTLNRGSVYPVYDLAKGYATVSMPGRVIDPGDEVNAQSKKKKPHKNNPKKQGTLTNFRLTKDINAWSEADPRNFSDDNYPSEFAVLKNVSYFVADDGIHGAELWRSDGTAAGTYLLKDVNPGEASGLLAGNIQTVGDKLIFPGTTDGHGTEPWISDGTPEGTFELMDITSGEDGSDPKRFVSVGNTTYFVANRSQLWTTDGTPGNMQLINLPFYEGFEVAEVFHLTRVNDAVYFVVWGMSGGLFLWKSDQPGAAYFVADLGYYLGPIYSFEPHLQFTAYKDKLLFFFDNSKLWISDGTYQGTVPVKNIQNVIIPVPTHTVYREHPLKIINNVVYIAGYSYPDGECLYKYDDSNDEGIVLVKKLSAEIGTASISHTDFAVVNEELYFKINIADGGYHDELWKTRGNEATTQLVKRFAPGESTFNYISASGALFFNVVTQVNGNELWRSDGTETGTSLVKDIWPGSASGAPFHLTPFNSKIIFSGINEATGKSLYISDGTTVGTVLVKDINGTSTSGSNAGGINSNEIGVLRHGVVFAAKESRYGNELYISDGTEKKTSLVRDIVIGQESSNPRDFLSRSGKVYFRADNMDQSPGFPGSFIYQTDGTAKGTKKIGNVKAGRFHSYDVAPNGLVFYVVQDTVTLKVELWRSNGRAEETFLLNDNIFGGFVIAPNNTVIFTAADEEHGAELWITDGSAGNTKMVKDIYPGWFGSGPHTYFVFENEVFFGARGHGGNNFWKTDGTTGGTVPLGPMEPIDYLRLGKQLLVAVKEPRATVGIGLQLFVTDGTKANTKLVKKINPTTSTPVNLTDVDGTVFFSSDGATNRIELWKTDGTEAGTLMVKEINPGPFWSWLSDFQNIDGRLYFLNSVEGGTLWTSDGTAEHTGPVSNEVLDKLFNLKNLVYADDKVYFGANSSRTGTELFVADVLRKAPKTLARAALAFEEGSTGFEPVLFPNPTEQVSAVRLPATVTSVTIYITDISGKTIWRKTAANTNNVNLPVETFAAGVYLVNITFGKERRILKLVKN